jgi:hypothetical protein
LDLAKRILKYNLKTYSMFPTHHVLHERGQLLGDDCKLLEGGPDVVGFVFAHDGRVAQLGQRLGQVHLVRDMICKKRRRKEILVKRRKARWLKCKLTCSRLHLQLKCCAVKSLARASARTTRFWEVLWTSVYVGMLKNLNATSKEEERRRRGASKTRKGKEEQ